MGTHHPKHGAWCGAQTYPTRCSCGARVYYFHCNHGCSVLFDALGWPWPQHRCSKYAHAQTAIDESYVPNILPPAERPWQSGRPIRVCAPLPQGAAEGVGVIKEVLDLGLFGKPHSPSASTTPVTRNRPATADLLRVTVDVDGPDCEEVTRYRMLVEQETWSQLGGERLDPVRFTVAGRIVLKQSAFWRCTSLDWPDSERPTKRDWYRVELNGGRYIWTGKAWLEERSLLQPPDVVMRQLSTFRHPSLFH